MSRIRDIASMLTSPSSMATDAEVSAVSAYISTNVAGKNFIINGGMDIAQRGTSITGVNGYCLDRWIVNGFGTSSNISVNQFLVLSGIPGLRYYMRVAPTTSNTQNFWISQSLETNEVIRLAGKQVTLSFYYRVSSAFTGTWQAAAAYSTGTDANLHYPAAATSIFNENLGSSGAWQRYTKTFTVPSNATSFAVQLQSTNNVLGTAMFDFTGVQLEIGSVATEFSRAGGDFQGEMFKCQRYYQQIETFSNYLNATAVYLPAYTNSYAQSVQFFTKMRVSPSITFIDLVSNSSKVTGYLTGGGVNNLTPNVQGSANGFRFYVSGEYRYFELLNVYASAEI